MVLLAPTALYELAVMMQRTYRADRLSAYPEGETTMRDRVVIIGDVTSGFRVHGMFEDNSEAFAYVERHRDRFPGAGWKDNAHSIMIVNFDSMTETEVSRYEREVGSQWADLKEEAY